MKLKKHFIVVTLVLCFLPVLYAIYSSKAIIGLNNLEDRIAHINAFVDIYLKLKSSINPNPIPMSVRKGKDGWFFLGDNYANVYSKSLNLIPTNEEKIKKTAHQIDSLKRFSESLGCTFYFAVGPNKHTIYPEFLPQKALPSKSKEIDLLKRKLLMEHDIDLIDMKEYIIPLKDSIDLYYKTDSHWNEYGAFLGAKKVIEHINQDYLSVQKLDIHDFIFEEFVYDQGGLTKMLKQHILETQYHITLKDSSFIKETKQQLKSYYCHRYYNPTKKLKLLIIGDSFWDNMAKFFANTFGEVYKVHVKDFNYSILIEERPDILLLELVERDCADLPFFE